MVDIKPQVYEKLCSLGLPCFYELFLTKDTQVPCISYYEMDNQADQEGDTLGYSTIRMSVKVWGKSIKEMTSTALQIDAVMREAGFKRVTTNELWLDGIGQRQMIYQAIGFENFN